MNTVQQGQVGKIQPIFMRFLQSKSISVELLKLSVRMFIQDSGWKVPGDPQQCITMWKNISVELLELGVHTRLLVKSTRWSTPLPSAAPRFACCVSVDKSWKVDARLNEETLDQSASSARPSWSQDMNTWWNGSNCLGASLWFPGGLRLHFERQYRPFLSKHHLLSNAALVSTICNVSRNHYILTMKP